MQNPFLFGDIVKGKYFADRESEQKLLVSDLLSGQNVLLFSPRRYGKTSLVLRVLETLRSKKAVCAYVDFFRATSLESLGQIYASAITQASASKLQEAVEFIRSHFPTIVPKVVLKGEGTPEVEVDFDTRRRDTEKWLDEVFDMPQKIAKRKGKRFVIVLDEFQEVITLGIQSVVEKVLRSRAQHHDRVSYVFMGSKRHLLDELFLDKNRPLYRIAKPMPLGRIPAPKLSAFIKKRFKSAAVHISQPQIDSILELTDCHPYYTQQLCSEVFNVIVPRKSIAEGNISRAKDNCLQSQSYAYTTVWDGLSAKQRSLLKGLATVQKANIFSQDFLSRFRLGSAAGVQTAAQALLKKGVLERENGHYLFSDVFFVHWLRDKII